MEEENCLRIFGVIPSGRGDGGVGGKSMLIRQCYICFPSQDTRYDQENVAPGGGEQPQQYEDTYRMSPYPKIPPISITEEELDRQLAEFEQNGYASMYKQHKNKPAEEKPWYQVYTIKDYRKMQNEVRLSRAPLGPDLDNETYKEKMEKRHKQFEYARMVMEKNRQELDIKKPPSHPRKEDEKPNKRKTVSTPRYTEQTSPEDVGPRPKHIVDRSSKRQAVSLMMETNEFPGCL
ncbi:uncharacterized protein LOC134235115 [Saccostrea cucullata]|uniref:uncharacterized protein LOC134235115 n=1 Tax=Saccostrea cuccullata TaxID=36930 RepID=UPI002ED56E30